MTCISPAMQCRLSLRVDVLNISYKTCAGG